MQILGIEALLTKPRAWNADLIVKRLRAAMDSVARDRCPDRPVVVTDPELDLRHVDRALEVPWWSVSGPARTFLASLIEWKNTGTTASATAVITSADVLIGSWTAAVESAIEIENLAAVSSAERCRPRRR
jgi:hypothetical protein